MVKFNQNAWLKPYIDLSSDLRKKKQKIILKRFFKVDEQCKFWKSYGICEKK